MRAQSHQKKRDEIGPPAGMQHMDRAWRTLMNTLGVFLIFFFVGLVLMVLYGFFYDVCRQYYFAYENVPLTAAMITIGLIFGFNIIYNYMMAVLTPPGGTAQINDRELVPRTESDEQDYASVNRDDALEREDEESGEEHVKKCKKCILPKPARAHHCSVCGKCVLKMDHHCPWINNCVGLNNNRYFLLMITYLASGVFTYFIFSLPIVSFDEFRRYQKVRTDLFALNFALSIAVFVVLVPFNVWNWYLATTGQTTIEFWLKRSQRYADDKSKHSFGHTNRRKNLEVIFGTRDLWKMFLPSTRRLNCDGINWGSDKDDSIQIRTEA